MTKSGKHFGKSHYVFKRPSAAGASESVYMRESVNAEFVGSFNMEPRQSFPTRDQHSKMFV